VERSDIMPKVGKKKFPYTPAGKKAAKKAAKKASAKKASAKKASAKKTSRKNGKSMMMKNKRTNKRSY
jgi:predicted  nucleic acid-binding Zn-ribbon protein